MKLFQELSRRQRRWLLRICGAALLFAAGLLLPRPVSLIAFAAAYLLAGGDVLLKAGRNIVHGRVFDENFLMALATVGAIALAEYPEAVAVMLFYQIGELFQSIAVGRSRRSVAALMDIRPDQATLLREGEEIEADPEEVSVGDLILVRPGERVPLDGLIVSGSTAVDTSALTGESLPRDLQPGDQIVSGTVNISAPITVQVTADLGASTVTRVLELVEESASRKARAENFITRFARWYTPAVTLAAALLALLPPLISGGGWSLWLNRALIFLVVSCPYALVISVPLSFFGGIGGASRQGILIKGANFLEALAKVDRVAWDKTGTLTTGRFAVTEIFSPVLPEEDLLELAARLESYSNHPLARAIVEARGRDTDRLPPESVSELPGRGVKARIDGETVYAGNRRLMEEAGVAAEAESAGAATLIHLARKGLYLGHIALSDQLKPEAEAACAALRQAGVERIVMLSGDRSEAADAVGRELGLDEVKADLSPAGKLEALEEELAGEHRGKLAFVGDGVNDAPVLSRADVGIAMGALGSDAAIEAADVVLMDDDPGKAALVIKLARRTMGIVWQNIVFALGVKFAVLVLGALGLAQIWAAVFADVGVAVLAILNAMRTLRTGAPSKRSI